MATILGSFSRFSTSIFRPYIEYSVSQDIVNNQSTITSNLYFAKYNASYYAVQNSFTNTMRIDGSSVNYTDNFDLRSTSVPEIELIRTRTLTVTHNADGTRTCYIGASGDTGSTVLGTYNFGQTVTLPTIDRGARITNALGILDLDAGTMSLDISNPLNYYVQIKVVDRFSTVIKTFNLGQVVSASLTFTQGELAPFYTDSVIQTGSTVNCTTQCLSFSDGGYTTQVGSTQSLTTSAQISPVPNPAFADWDLLAIDKSVEVRDSYNNLLTTSSTNTLTGSSSKIIKGYNTVQGTVTVANKASSFYGATVTKYKFAQGTQNIEASYSDVSNVVMQLSDVLGASHEVTAVDTRLKTTTVTKSFSNIAEYFAVDIYNLTALRNNNVDAGITLSFGGTMFNGYFGGGTSGVQNTITGHYRYKETTETWASQTWNSITITNTGGTLSFSGAINGDLGATGFSVGKSFDIQVRVYDKLTAKIIETTLDKGIPAIDITQKGVAVLTKFNDTLSDGFQVAGVIYDDGLDINEGWEARTETWTRTGNHTFTVAGDVTGVYTKGVKVRYKDGGSFEYGIVQSSSYSAPNTTITLITNTDYAMANATITDKAISRIENPQGFPHYFAYTSTVTGFSGTPTVSSRFSVQGRVMWVYIDITGTSNATSFSFTTPMNVLYATNHHIRRRNNGTYGTGLLEVVASSSTANIYSDMAGTNWVNSGTKALVAGFLPFPI